MNHPSPEAFFTSERSHSLTDQEVFRLLFEHYPLDSQECYILTFYGSFAWKLIKLLRREGPAVQGYEQMQQSFKESVEKVSTTIDTLEPALRQAFMNVINTKGLQSLLADLAIVKDWLNEQGYHPSK